MPYAFIVQVCYLAPPPPYDLYHFYLSCIMLFTLVPIFYFILLNHPVPVFQSSARITTYIDAQTIS